MTAPTSSSALQRWSLASLLLFAAVAILPELFQAEVVKRAASALFAALAILPMLALAPGPAGHQALRRWFTSPAARLLLLVFALCSVRALPFVEHAAVMDRLLNFGLINIAAVLGVLAAASEDTQHPTGPDRFGQALRWAVLPGAVIAWMQALGWESSLTSGSGEVVALSGNSTHAGALLALGSVAWLVRLTHGGLRTPGSPLDRGRLEMGPLLCLALVSGALILTRARGARLAAALALAVLCVVTLMRQRQSSRSADGVQAAPAGPASQQAVGPTFRPAAVGLLFGILLAAWAGGSDALTATKLEHSGSVLSGEDLTVNVRLALAQSTLSLMAESPGLGVGLGRFRAEFPPYRDPGEAALPGLGGANTEPAHPHNEFLLAAAEGGLLAGLLLLILVALSLRRAWALTHDGRASSLLAFLVLLTGTLLACVQNAWGDVATALPFFAAMGFVWASKPSDAGRDGEREMGSRRPRAFVAAPTLLLALGLALLAWPRLDSHLSLRSFLLRAQATDNVIGPHSFAALLHAERSGAGDVDIQRMVATYGAMYAPTAPDATGKVEAIQAVDRARERLKSLAPYAP